VTTEPTSRKLSEGVDPWQHSTARMNRAVFPAVVLLTAMFSSSASGQPSPNQPDMSVDASTVGNTITLLAKGLRSAFVFPGAVSSHRIFDGLSLDVRRASRTRPRLKVTVLVVTDPSLPAIVMAGDPRPNIVTVAVSHGLRITHPMDPVASMPTTAGLGDRTPVAPPPRV
jgi:hypothetical protein